MKKCIFFDRDGVVNFRPVGDYVKSFSEFHFVHDFLPFFRHIKSEGYLAIIISNQQGVGKGIMNNEQLIGLTQSFQSELQKLTSFEFDDIFYCTELKDSASFRRKPNPGMLLEAMEKWDIHPDDSMMIGDSESDIIAAKNAGIIGILLKPPYSESDSSADFIFPTLHELQNFLISK